MRATTSSPGTATFRVGDYQVTDELGAEEAGSFYFGEHVLLPRKAAIKIMHAGGSYNKSTAVAMLREACLVDALSHPGIPRVYECGVLPDKRPWTAFELVEGHSVATQIAETPMAVADVVVLVRDAADVLDHIHRRGIVHRAITSEAIIPTPYRRFPIFVRHWGEACTLDSASAHADPRDDIRALGVVASKALAGTMPPRDVALLIDQMMASDVTRRPTSAELREKAAWLASTVEIKPSAPIKKTYEGIGDRITNDVEDVGAGFTIRINTRTPSR
ncbi:MAG: protein kinase domain-containing protein [Kofleriaceae bacterium]